MANMKINRRAKRIAEKAVFVCMNCVAYGLMGVMAFAFAIAACHIFGWSTDWANGILR